MLVPLNFYYYLTFLFFVRSQWRSNSKAIYSIAAIQRCAQQQTAEAGIKWQWLEDVNIEIFQACRRRNKDDREIFYIHFFTLYNTMQCIYSVQSVGKKSEVLWSFLWNFLKWKFTVPLLISFFFFFWCRWCWI